MVFWDGSCRNDVRGADIFIKIFTQSWMDRDLQECGLVLGKNPLDFEITGSSMLIDSVKRFNTCVPNDEHFESKDHAILSRKDIVMCVRQVCDMMTARACGSLLRNFLAGFYIPRFLLLANEVLRKLHGEFLLAIDSSRVLHISNVARCSRAAFQCIPRA